MENLEEKYNSLMSDEGIAKLNPQAALDRTGILIDLLMDLGKAEGLERAIKLSDAKRGTLYFSEIFFGTASGRKVDSRPNAVNALGWFLGAMLARTIHESLLRRPILSPGGAFLVRSPRRTARVRLRRSHLREAPAGFGLSRLATAFMNNPGFGAGSRPSCPRSWVCSGGT